MAKRFASLFPTVLLLTRTLLLSSFTAGHKFSSTCLPSLLHLQKQGHCFRDGLSKQKKYRGNCNDLSNGDILWLARETAVNSSITWENRVGLLATVVYVFVKQMH